MTPISEAYITHVLAILRVGEVTLTPAQMAAIESYEPNAFA